MEKNEFLENLYAPTMEILRNIPSYDKTHRPMPLIMKGLYPMNEIGLERILNHGKDGFGVILNPRHVNLDWWVDFRMNWFAWSKIYSEKENGEYSESYIFYAHDTRKPDKVREWKELYDVGVHFAEFYGNDVYLQAPDKEPITFKNRELLDVSNEIIHFENYLRKHGPSDFTDRVRRIQSGEVFLED